jgi:hypothetical protein
LGLRNWLTGVFGSAGATPADAPSLSAQSESALASSLQNLPVGERGFIPLADAARIFSTEPAGYAFGEMDEAGKARLARFAAEAHCFPEFMPTEGRLYFTRTS